MTVRSSTAQQELAGRSRQDITSLNMWDRLEAESPAAWNGFTVYRDLGLTRTLEKVLNHDSVTQVRSTINDWSQRFSWVIRVAAWDAHVDREHQLWLLEQQRTATTRHVRQAQTLSTKWLQRLQTLDPSELSVDQVLRYADIATKMERTALGLDQRFEVQVRADIQHTVSGLSMEDTSHRLEQLQREIAARQEDLRQRNAIEQVIDAEIVEETT